MLETSSVLRLAALLALAACNDSSSPPKPAAMPQGMPAGSGGSAAAGMMVDTSGITTGGVGTPAVMPAVDGAPSAGVGASTSAAGAGGAAGSAITDAGTAIDSGHTDTTSSTGPSACTRELLESAIAGYFSALAAHDPSSLSLADDVKFTENGEVMKLGQGLWQTAGAMKYSQSALDIEMCSSATQAIVPDGSMDIPLGLRLKLEARRIREIETIAVRPGDYKVLGSDFPSDPKAIIAANDAIKWEEAVPADQRNTRDEIASWIDKYFKVFPRGVCNVASSCKRLENGGGSFGCDFGASCDSGPAGSGPGVMQARVILVDVEAGIGVGFTMFMGNTDMHMYKMYGSKVYAVHTILGAAGSSGWD